MIRNAVKIVFALTLLVQFFCLAAASAQTEHKVFLAGTDHELHVYRVIGAKPGKTLMIIGGIQGDEPSGYITADLYADIHLQKGNLIVVPRANFRSILLNHRDGASGDMNRKFATPTVGGKDLELEVVRILKGLIDESDGLLNLHEGSGFYSSTWISEQENPTRYGQSIIYDAETYQPPGKKAINLGEMAREAVARVNSKIAKPRYFFRANNHNTISNESKHAEQRKSASYYALTKRHIPAFGIEISKLIATLEEKIQLHKVVVNAMMLQFGLELDVPGGSFESPSLDYLIVKVNDNLPYALANETVLPLRPGDKISINDIVANYERGVVADIAGFGTVNDTGSTLVFDQPTRIVVRKDAIVCGWVDLVVDSSGEPSRTGEIASDTPKKQSLSVADLQAVRLIINVNGVKKRIINKGSLKVPEDGLVILEAIETNIAMLDKEVVVNFKGFVPPKSLNDGNDLKWPINPSRDLWRKYSENGAGIRYPINVTYLDREIGQFWVEMIN